MAHFLNLIQQPPGTLFCPVRSCFLIFYSIITVSEVYEESFFLFAFKVNHQIKSESCSNYSKLILIYKAFLNISTKQSSVC